MLAIIPERLASKKNKLLIQYLIDIKHKFPELIEPHQHGYNHQKESLECCIPDYQEQFHRKMTKNTVRTSAGYSNSRSLYAHLLPPPQRKSRKICCTLRVRYTV